MEVVTSRRRTTAHENRQVAGGRQPLAVAAKQFAVRSAVLAAGDWRLIFSQRGSVNTG